MRLCIYDKPIPPDFPGLEGVFRVGDHSSQDEFHGTAVNWVARQHAPEAEQFAYSNRRAPFEECLRWCIENGIDVLNVSALLARWGARNRALQEALDAGLIIIAAAGNDGPDGKVGWPASDPRVIAVGALDSRTGEVSGYSTQGEEIDIVARGDWLIPMPSGDPVPVRGTSFASPVIAAYCTRWKAVYPEGTWRNFKEFLQANAKDLGIPGKDKASGWGLFAWPENIGGDNMVNLDLNTPSNVTEAVLDEFMKGTPLEGLGESFVKAENEVGVNAVYLCAHAVLESGWGRSRIAQEKNNLFGFGAYDSSPYDSAKSFSSFEDCIMKVARYIKENYLTPGGKYYNGPTLKGMNVKYASDPNWADKIASLMEKIEELRKTMKDYKGHWAEKQIDEAKRLSLVAGYPDGTFRPDNYLTRAEFVTAALNLYQKIKAEIGL